MCIYVLWYYNNGCHLLAVAAGDGWSEGCMMHGKHIAIHFIILKRTRILANSASRLPRQLKYTATFQRKKSLYITLYVITQHDKKLLQLYYRPTNSFKIIIIKTPTEYPKCMCYFHCFSSVSPALWAPYFDSIAKLKFVKFIIDLKEKKD